MEFGETVVSEARLIGGFVFVEWKEGDVINDEGKLKNKKTL